MPDHTVPKAPASPATRLTHSGRAPIHEYGFVNPPVHRGSTMLFPTFADKQRANSNPLSRGPLYGIKGGPTHHALEDVVAEIEGGTHCQIVSTGLAAVTVPLLAYLSAGDHLLMPDSVYGPTRTFCDRFLTRMGVTTTYYDPEITPAGLTALIRRQTRVLYTESPGSHSFEVQDIPALAAVAHAHDLTVMLDNTWGIRSFQPFTHGVISPSKL